MAKVLMDTQDLKKTALFVGKAKESLARLASLEKLAEALASKIPSVVDVLVKQGLVSDAAKADKIKQLTANPELILADLEKTAQMVKPAALGGASNVEDAAELTADEVFRKRFIG